MQHEFINKLLDDGTAYARRKNPLGCTPEDAAYGAFLRVFERYESRGLSEETIRRLFFRVLRNLVADTYRRRKPGDWPPQMDDIAATETDPGRDAFQARDDCPEILRQLRRFVEDRHKPEWVDRVFVVLDALSAGCEFGAKSEEKSVRRYMEKRGHDGRHAAKARQIIEDFLRHFNGDESQP